MSYNDYLLLFRFAVRRLIDLLTVRKFVLGRVACLGKDSFKLLGGKHRLINIQKGRIDLLLDKERFSYKNLKNLSLIIRDDIKWLLLEQAFKYKFFHKNPEFIIMDSYSELTDQLFRDKGNNSVFYANFSDVDKSLLVDELIVCEGLIDITTVEKLYYLYFKSLSSKYLNIPIIYIHFPIERETRQLFINRALYLKEIMKRIQQEIDNLRIIEVPSCLALLETEDDFPYHYSENVYIWISGEISKIIK